MKSSFKIYRHDKMHNYKVLHKMKSTLTFTLSYFYKKLDLRKIYIIAIQYWFLLKNIYIYIYIYIYNNIYIYIYILTALKKHTFVNGTFFQIVIMNFDTLVSPALKKCYI